jgi:CDP-diacylglycerol--serine O-phosphatidyltransferase
MTTSPFPLRRKEDEPFRQKGQRKGMYLLPSLFTTANIAAGYYAISQITQGSVTEYWHFDNAARAIGVAVVFDALDGFLARMTRTHSDFGRELDSLADVITFGVAPALLAWFWGFRWLPVMENADLRTKLIELGAVFSFVFLMAGASRLARFNIQSNPQPSNPGRPGKKYFVGMPIPAGAGVIAAVVHFSAGNPVLTWWLSAIWLVLMVTSSFLMVSTWRFYSFKEIDWRRRHPFRLIVVVALLFSGIWFFSRPVLFFIAMTYMLSGIFWRLMYLWNRRSGSTPPSTYTEAPELQ